MRRINSTLIQIFIAGLYKLKRLKINLRLPKKRAEWQKLKIKLNKQQLLIGDFQVMQRWESPLMKVMAEAVTSKGGDILEIGFGMGISASHILNSSCSSYTVIECHPKIIKYAQDWALQYKTPIKVLEGYWEDILPNLEKYDGILFDTFPISKNDLKKSSPNILDFVPRHLKKGGIFTCYSGAYLYFRSKTFTKIKNTFSKIIISKVNVSPPKDCEYYGNNEMLVPICYL